MGGRALTSKKVSGQPPCGLGSGYSALQERHRQASCDQSQPRVTRLSPSVRFWTEGKTSVKVQGSEGASRAQAVCPLLCLLNQTDFSPLLLEGPLGIHATSGKARDRTLTQAVWPHAEGEGQARPANPIRAGDLLRCHNVTVIRCRHFLEKQSFGVSLNPTIKRNSQQLLQSPKSTPPFRTGKVVYSCFLTQRLCLGL